MRGAAVPFVIFALAVSGAFGKRQDVEVEKHIQEDHGKATCSPPSEGGKAQCCICNADPVTIEQLKSDYVIWWSCGGSCSACDVRRRDPRYLKGRKPTPGAGYGLAELPDDRANKFDPPEAYENDRRSGHEGCRAEGERLEKEAGMEEIATVDANTMFDTLLAFEEEDDDEIVAPTPTDPPVEKPVTPPTDAPVEKPVTPPTDAPVEAPVTDTPVEVDEEEFSGVPTATDKPVEVDEEEISGVVPTATDKPVVDAKGPTVEEFDSEVVPPTATDKPVEKPPVDDELDFDFEFDNEDEAW